MLWPKLSMKWKFSTPEKCICHFLVSREVSTTGRLFLFRYWLKTATWSNSMTVHHWRSRNIARPLWEPDFCSPDYSAIDYWIYLILCGDFSGDYSIGARSRECAYRGKSRYWRPWNCYGCDTEELGFQHRCDSWGCSAFKDISAKIRQVPKTKTDIGSTSCNVGILRLFLR